MRLFHRHKFKATVVEGFETSSDGQTLWVFTAEQVTPLTEDDMPDTGHYTFELCKCGAHRLQPHIHV